ncbi:hypothetical protein JD78_03178 [Modestobacter roseus]|uniref:Uncharacterized protein n=2 Tax=Modestobacter roseus TaxID=1181884 RepID=A0A562IV34_9ACTN|nr:hypothetical protein JD78_03178 [Modestobacter roseus]
MGFRTGRPGIRPGMTESAPQHSSEPAEGSDPAVDQEGGRTPHASEPAEGSEAAAEDGVDPENRISGA